MEEIYYNLTGVDIEEQKKIWDERGKGYYGEYLVLKTLYQNIPGTCKILMNLQIPASHDRTTEIDLLMIHKTGFYVFEIKHALCIDMHIRGDCMIYLATQKGIKKVESEDAVLIGNEVICDAVGEYMIPQTGFICVADGVGGHNGGRTASHYVLNALSGKNPMPEQLRNTVLQINTDLLKASEANREFCEMATTLSGIYLFGASALIMHIGNTRIYAKQGNYLKQLTSDHTVYNWLNSLGRFEEAENCKRNEIVSMAFN